MLKSLLFVVFSVLLGCFGKESQSITGYYRSPDNNNLNKIRYGKFVVNLTMDINKNGTYVFSTCTQTEKGKWKMNKNVLEFYCEEKKFIHESFNHLEKYKKVKICDPKQLFLIEDDKIYQKIKNQF